MKIREYLGLYNIENVKYMEYGLGDKKIQSFAAFYKKKSKNLGRIESSLKL